MSFVYTGLDVLDDLLKAAGFDKRGGQSRGVAGWLAAQDPSLEVDRYERRDLPRGGDHPARVGRDLGRLT
jgi:hypothetical protein